MTLKFGVDPQIWVGRGKFFYRLQLGAGDRRAVGSQFQVLLLNAPKHIAQVSGDFASQLNPLKCHKFQPPFSTIVDIVVMKQCLQQCLLLEPVDFSRACLMHVNEYSRPVPKKRLAVLPGECPH